MLSRMRRTSLMTLLIAMVSGCNAPPKAEAETAPETAPADAETAETPTESATPAVEHELIPDAPDEIAPPEPIVELAREVVAGMNAPSGEDLNGPLMPKDVYLSDRMHLGLANNKEAIKKLPAQFFWDNHFEDSDDDRSWLHRTWSNKPTEFVSVRVNKHEDRGEIELWKGSVLRVSEKASGKQTDLLILGEFVHDKVDDQWYLLRYAKRRKR